MASLRDIRKRIRSVKGSQKITRAMKLVAASKLKRAQDAMLQARPYAEQVLALLQRVAAHAAATAATEPLHPLLELRPPRRVLLVVLTSDKGLCGPFNSSILRRAERFLQENAERFEYVEVAALGRKGRDYFAKRPGTAVRALPTPSAQATPQDAQALTDALVAAYSDEQLDAVFLLYNEFQSAITQRVALLSLLPILPQEPAAATAAASVPQDYIYEPSRAGVLQALLPRYVATLVMRALLESVACEHGARMAAMDAATRNARELTDKLTLQYNRARQATITRELMDIVGGAEAQKG